MDVEDCVTPEQAQSVAEKELGNAAYKKKDFETALAHYNKAIELDPTEMTFLNNIAGNISFSFSSAPLIVQFQIHEELSSTLCNFAAVYFEQKEYDMCIEQCKKAIAVGQEHRASFANFGK